MKLTGRLRFLVSSALVCLALLILWFFGVNGAFHPTTAAMSLESFQQSSQPLTSAVQKSLLTECHGFTNECELEELGLKLRLSFEGWSWAKPRYAFMNSFGGSTGWQQVRAYYGTRKLLVSTNDDRVLAEFKQMIWNSSEYSDFSQIITLDEAHRTLYVSSSPLGFSMMTQEAYPIRY